MFELCVSCPLILPSVLFIFAIDSGGEEGGNLRMVVDGMETVTNFDHFCKFFRFSVLLEEEEKDRQVDVE